MREHGTVLFSKLIHHRETVELGHQDVEKNDVVVVRDHERDRLATITSGGHFVSGPLQDRSNHRPNRSIITDDKNPAFGVHVRSLHWTAGRKGKTLTSLTH